MTNEGTRTDSVIRVALVDPHPVVAAGIRASVAHLHESDVHINVVAVSADELLDTNRSDGDIVLFEPAQECHPWRSMTQLAKMHPAVICFTADERPLALSRALEAGAGGIILKSDPLDELIWAVKRAAQRDDDPYLSPAAEAAIASLENLPRLSTRQVETLAAVAGGLSYQLAAKKLGISVASVREHLRRASSAYRACGIETWNAHGLVTQARLDGNL